MSKAKKHGFYFDLTSTASMFRLKRAVLGIIGGDAECPVAISERWAGAALIIAFEQDPSLLISADLPYTLSGEVTFVDEGRQIRLYVHMEVDLSRWGWLERFQLRQGLPKVYRNEFEMAVKQVESSGRGLN